jgi:hypothetical protein
MKTKQHKTDSGTAKSSPDLDLHVQIEKRAYEIWLADGSRHGDDVSHWVQAETEVFASRRQS